MRYRILVGMFIVAFLTIMAEAEVATVDMRKTQETPAFKLFVLRGGDMRVNVDGETYRISSRFSWPGMPTDGWNRLGGKSDGKWKVTVDRSEAKKGIYTVKGVDKHYTLERRICVLSDKITVKDMIINTTKGDLAVAFDHFLKPESKPKQLYFHGQPGMPYRDKVNQQNDVTPINTTIFVAGKKHGLGILLEDDFYRLQALYVRDGNSGVIKNRSFGLPAGDSYTFEWSLIPTASNDYYEFINKVRDILGVNFTINGSHMFTFGGNGLNVKAYDKQLIKFYDYLGLRIVSSPQIWLGGTSFYAKRGNRGDLYVEKDYLESLKIWNKRVDKLMPKAKIYVKIQTTFCGPYQKKGEPIPFKDATMVEADGTRKGYKRGCYPHYPAEGNSYEKYLRGLIDLVLVKNKIPVGIYFDTFTYNYWSKYGRWTYDKWDKRTIDIDPKTWTIKAKKADLCKLSESARYKLVKHVRKMGGEVLVNHSILTKKMRSLKINSFQEYQKLNDLVLLHGTAPVTLGYYPGYKTRSSWKDEADLYDDVRKNLRVGLLTHGYWPTPVVKKATIYKNMFPITPVQIGPGYVIGKERVVTLVPGFYCLESGEEPMVWFYDAKGHECSGKKRIHLNENGKTYVEVEVPQDGAVVLSEPPSIRECLTRELGADAE